MGEGQHPDSAKGIRNHVSSLGRGGGDSTLDSTKGIRNPSSSLGRGGGTALGIQLKEFGIALALRGALGAGDSTRDSIKGIQNPSSTLGGSGGGRQHPGFN